MLHPVPGRIGSESARRAPTMSDLPPKRGGVARDRARAFGSLTYRDPREVLVELRRVERLIPPGTDPKIRHLRTHELRDVRELRLASLFCYGWGQISVQPMLVAHAEAQDYDAVATWIDSDTANFAPIQLKEVVPTDLNPEATVQAVIDDLTKYRDSRDLTVAVHLNQSARFSPLALKIPKLDIASLWIFGSVTPDQSRWGVWGNFLETIQYGEFAYPDA